MVSFNGCIQGQHKRVFCFAESAFFKLSKNLLKNKIKPEKEEKKGERIKGKITEAVKEAE